MIGSLTRLPISMGLRARTSRWDGWAISVISACVSRSLTIPPGTRSGSDSMAMPASTRSSCRSLKMFLVGAVTISSRTAGSFSDRSRNRRGMKICAIPDPMPSVSVSDGAPRSRRAVSERLSTSPMTRSAS
jgi:hypothetical protein